VPSTNTLIGSYVIVLAIILQGINAKKNTYYSYTISA